MELREYCPLDCPEMASLFYQTVHTVNACDYTPQQLDAWADGHTDLAAWNRSFLSHYTLVAQEEDQIIGFGDICRDGYLDRLYVHPDWQRQGVATALCDRLEACCGAPRCMLMLHHRAALFPGAGLSDGAGAPGGAQRGPADQFFGGKGAHSPKRRSIT